MNRFSLSHLSDEELLEGLKHHAAQARADALRARALLSELDALGVKISEFEREGLEETIELLPEEERANPPAEG